MSESPIHFIKYYIYGKKALIILSSNKYCNSKKFSIVQNVLQNVLCFSQIYLKVFFILPMVVYNN